MAQDTGDSSTSPKEKEGPCGKLPLSIQKHLANATKAELKALDGIGTKAAELIANATGGANCFESWEQVKEIKGVGPKKVQILQHAGYILGPSANALDEVSGIAISQRPDKRQTKAADPDECLNEVSKVLQSTNGIGNGPVSHAIAPSSSGSSSDGDDDSDTASEPSDADSTGSMVIRNINIATADDLASGAMRLGRTVADRLTKERAESGQFLSFKDLTERVKGMGEAKARALAACHFEVRPTSAGLRHSLLELSIEALEARGLSKKAASSVLQARCVKNADDQDEEAEMDLAELKRGMTSEAWGEAVRCLLGDSKEQITQSSSCGSVSRPKAEMKAQGKASEPLGRSSGTPSKVDSADAKTPVYEPLPMKTEKDRRPVERKKLQFSRAENSTSGKAGKMLSSPQLAEGKGHTTGSTDCMSTPTYKLRTRKGRGRDGNRSDSAANEKQSERTQPGCRWFDDPKYPPDAPFPLEFCENLRNSKAAALQGEKWEYFYDHIGPLDSKPGFFDYNGKKLSKLEASNLRARWTTAYPVLPDTKSHGNGREKTRPDTSSAKLRQEAWDALMDLEENVKLRLELPKNLKDDFRLDPFGNVVALRAEPRFSVCGFQVDHIFPWARGGLTVRNNLMALHWYANQHVKNDAILNANEVQESNGKTMVDRMVVGLSKEQFLGLVKIRESIPKRHKQRQFDAQMQHLLFTMCVGLPNLSWPQMQGSKPYMQTLEPGAQCLQALKDLETAACADLFGA